MARTLDVAAVKIGLLVPTAATVKLATDESGRTSFFFGWTPGTTTDDHIPPMEFREANADVAAGRFLEAGSAHELYRVFKEFGPLRRWPEESFFGIFGEWPEQQIPLEQVLAIQSTSRFMRERGTYQRICDLFENIRDRVHPEAMTQGDVLAVNSIPPFEASWEAPIKLRATCRGLLEALSCTLFLDQANERSRVFCARRECGKTFLKYRGEKRIYHNRKCGVIVAKAKFRAASKKKGVAR